MTDAETLNWDTECWKCGEETPVVWPKNTSLNSEVGEQLAELDEYNVERTYSNSLGKEVWGNICVECGAYQGNNFIRKEALQQFASVECPHCSEEHDWWPDDGMGGAFGQGWVDCPEYGGEVPVGEPDL